MNRLSQFFKKVMPWGKRPAVQETAPKQDPIAVNKHRSPNLKKSKRSRLSNIRRALKHSKEREFAQPKPKLGGTFSPYKHLTVKPFGRIQKTGAEKFKERA